MSKRRLLLSQPPISLHDDNGQTSHEDNYFRIKILAEEGRKYADIGIPFFKETEKPHLHKGPHHPPRRFHRRLRRKGGPATHPASPSNSCPSLTQLFPPRLP